MTLRPVHLPGPITVIPGDKLAGQVERLARDHPHLRQYADPEVILGELRARPDGVAATFAEPQGNRRDWALQLYLPVCVLTLFLTRERRDAYRISIVSPMRIHDHHRLAHGCLLVRPAGWRMVFDVRDIPAGSDPYWGPLREEWQRLGDDLAQQTGAPTLTGRETGFLDTLGKMIDAGERIALENAAASAPFPYRDVRPTGEKRQGIRSIYVFQLAGGRRPEMGEYVQVRGEPGLRGQVTRVERDEVTVRFDQAVNWTQFDQARQGELEPAPSRVVFDKQREAVSLLRARQAHNTTLLPALVERRVSPIPAGGAQPAEALDPDQLEAFRKGLATRDVLVVLGPPGTGKTRVISQLARSSAVELGERVLVTSHTNRAVDNVLARLPAELEAVRVGHDGGVTAEGRPYLLERRAAELRQRILDDAARAKAGYDRIGAAEQWTGELAARVTDLAAAAEREERARQTLDAAMRAVGGPVQARVDELRAERDRRSREIDRHRQRFQRRDRRLERARARAARPMIGVLFSLLVTLLGNRQAQASEQAGQLQDGWRQTGEALAQAQCELQAATRHDPSVQAARRQVDAAARRRAACRQGALRAAREAQAAVSAVETPPPVHHDADLARLLDRLREMLPLLGARATLLNEWHAEVSGATDQLYPELIRYADVIAATCIGAASRPELSGMRFELAIVDEAGQIGVADALVPLVRARRGVLVGDDQQLPPFLDSEVQAWGATVGDPLVRELLAKSALELLVDGLPTDHVVQLTRQRRMPAAIAGFVSAAFYGGRLRTAVRREHRDALFTSPIAVVDTAQLPPVERFERPGRGRERWGQAGFVNRVEAELLVELAVHYHHSGADWAVIVPYRAQVAKIAGLLTRRIGDGDLVNLNVGTVDSFQGGERAVILYGFTRSNSQGRVGFLKELRRANVAFTRAQHQLVLVGDLTTLTMAGDMPFRELARALRAKAMSEGDLRQYAEVHEQVRKLNRERR